MNSKTLKALAITAALASALTLSAQAASIGGATVDATNVNFRSAPNTGAPVYTKLSTGTNVVVGERAADGWFKVVYKGTVGYMSGDYLSFSETMDGSFGTGTINGTGVRMRDGASLDANIIGKYSNRERMSILGVAGNWYRVEYNGITGYVHSDYFALNGGVPEYQTGTITGGSTASGSESSDIGQQIVDTAMNYLGVPYVWAGTSPSGFDCSGFVYYVYKENGYSINRTAASIYENGVYVEKTDLQVGDAVCFSSSSSSIGHVGIYIGDGQFIHASSGTGAVIISDLSSTYYTNHYVGARRIV